jgi:hypothetical protein
LKEDNEIVEDVDANQREPIGAHILMLSPEATINTTSEQSPEKP